MRMTTAALVAMTMTMMAVPVAAQQHGTRGMAQQQSCAAMMGMHGAANMQGAHGMMGRSDQYMMGNDSLLTLMRFAPGHVLMFRDSLALTQNQVDEIQGLHGRMPMDSANAMAMYRHMDSASAMPMYRNATRVRDLLTASQRQRLDSLPLPCRMPAQDMHEGMYGDSGAMMGSTMRHRHQ